MIISVTIRAVTNGFVVSILTAEPPTTMPTSTEMVFDTMTQIVAYLAFNNFGPTETT
jgi:hypothetical protein